MQHFLWYSYIMDTTQLYNDLMALCTQQGSGFLFKDYTLDGRHVRVFDYRLVSYSDFKRPNAENCRGTMFEVSPDGQMIDLLCLPMPKFHGLGDCPDTMKLDLSPQNIRRIADKPDGSLMSTYLWNGQLKLKSKGSPSSKEALACEQFVQLDDTLHALLQSLTKQYTVNLEYTGPNNHLFLYYPDTKLTILNLRDRHTGAIHYLHEVLSPEQYAHVQSYDVSTYPIPEDIDAFLTDLATHKNIEGIVVELHPGQTCDRFKMKTQSYLKLHRAKSAISRDSRDIEHCWIVKEPKHIYHAVLHQKSDELRLLMRETPALVALIQQMEEEVQPKVMDLEHRITAFYHEHRNLDKVAFIQKSKKEWGTYAPLLIQTYVYGRVDVLSYAEKNPSQFVNLMQYQQQGPHYGNEHHPGYTP